MDADLHVVGKYAFEHEAALARAALDAEGIDSEILSDNAGSMIPGLQVLFPIRLVVRAEDAAEAQEILARPPQMDESEGAVDEL